MKLIMESWRGYISEDQDSPKVIFMAGAPGSGKSTVIDRLGLDTLEIINPDEFYEPALEKSGLGKDIAKIKESFLQSRQDFKDLLSEILQIVEPEDGWSHDILVEMYESAMGEANDDRTFIHNLETTREKYETERAKIVQQAKLFNQARKSAKSKQAQLADEGRSFIVDGTGGRFGVIRNQQEQLEDMGYDTAMIFVDIPLETAIDRQEQRGLEGGRTLDSRAIEKSWAAVNKNIEPYEELFGDNFFRVSAETEEMDDSIAIIKPVIDSFVATSQLNEADWQKYVRANYDKQLGSLLRHGGNQDSGPFNKKAPIDYRGSAPPTAAGG